MEEEEKVQPIQEYDTPVYIDTLRAVLGTMKIPILATFNQGNCLQSFLKPEPGENKKQVIFARESVYKVYVFEDFIENQQRQIEFFNELTVTTMAKEKRLPNVIHHQGTYMGVDHIALKLPIHQIDFRSYLRGRRNPKHLVAILL